jgi:hypothetical protein
MELCQDLAGVGGLPQIAASSRELSSSDSLVAHLRERTGNHKAFSFTQAICRWTRQLGAQSVERPSSFC